MNRTPNKKQPSRRPMTREQAILAEKMRAEQRRRKQENQALIKKSIAIGAFSILGAAICLIVIFSYILFDFHSYDKSPDEPVKVTYEKDNTIVLGEDYYSYKNGEYYISLTKLSQICSFTLHGNSKNMTLTIADGKSASFDTGTPNVRVGNTYSVLKNSSYFYGGQLFVPVSFFEDMCDGIVCEFDKLGKVKGLNLIFDKDFSFRVLAAKESDAVLYNKPSGSSESVEINFKADLSDYEMYMNPENKDDYLILINDSNKLSKDYIPDDLIEISDTRSDRSKEKMRFYAAKALEAMFIEMRANGFNNTSVISGYRSYEYQKNLLENETKAHLSEFNGDEEKAKTKALSTVFAPGASESQSGLCVSISTSNVLSEAFSETAEYKWLYSNCANFGFILRYPKDKSDITGTDFRPWHFRYVGRHHAKRIMDEGLCLEEYMNVID